MRSTAPALAYRPVRPFPLLVVRDGVALEREPEALERPREAVQAETAAHWTQVHERLRALATERAAHERELCRWLLAAARLAVHARAGYASLGEYAERLIGLSARQTEERLRVGRALAELPFLDGALASGDLSWSAVRELTRIVTRETEGAWLAWAKPRRIHEIEKAVATRRLGDGPNDVPDGSQRNHRLVFEVRAETMALFRDLQAKVRADLGADVDDDTLLFEIARRALGGPTDDGRANYQVAVTCCDACGKTTIDAAGVSHEVAEDVGEMAACDAQILGRVDVDAPQLGATRRARQTIPPATRRAVMRRDHGHCVVPGCTNHRFLDIHHIDPRAEGGGHDPERLAVLCGAHHRAVHRGALGIDGIGSVGFVVRHGNGAPYGARVSLAEVDVVRQVVGMLEQMGFKATQARALVDKALLAVSPNDAAVVLQAALRVS